MTKFIAMLFACVTTFLPAMALAAEGAPHIPGAELSILWVIPFACMLLSIAILPVAAPHFWHHNFGKISVFWGLAFLVPCAIVYGFSITLYEFLHTMLLEYVSFLVLLFSLFTVAGGVRLKGTLVGTPMVNTMLLLIGTLLASWMGTTGAAMLLIRPLLRANAHRKYKVHSVVFFIFLVANIGGSLTPLGDPPLFLGFLKGVSFFWTTTALFSQMVFLSVILLALYFVLDTFLFKKEGSPVPPNTGAGEKLGLDGKINLLLLLGVVGGVLASGYMDLNWADVTIFHVQVLGQNIARDVILLVFAGLSLKLTTKENRDLNGFNWAPIEEVAKLFLGIFVSMIPCLAILRAKTDGALAPLIRLVSGENGEPVDYMFFWITGLLSSFLDNAPTYVVFFETAGGDANMLMGKLASTLTAISAGAVFMGANSYIGNAPNFMVRSIAEDQGVPMPSFFGYMAWSFGILVPIFAVMTFIFYV